MLCAATSKYPGTGALPIFSQQDGTLLALEKLMRDKLEAVCVCVCDSMWEEKKKKILQPIAMNR